MSAHATPQRRSGENVPTSSPRTPRRSLTPLTKHAIQMSTTPIRNRLLLTPTKNKQRQVYDPLEDLRLLGRLFSNKMKSKPGTKPAFKSASPSIAAATTSYRTPSPDPNIDITTNTNINELKEKPVFSPQLSISPPADMMNVPSFINKDVRSFAQIFHQSSSFGTNIPSSEISDSIGDFEDTLKITESQSQSQSQPQSYLQSQTNSHTPYNAELKSEALIEDNIPDFGEISYTDRYNETFESHADTSNIALPEAILRDGSGILGMSDDELEEYNMSLSKLNESDSESSEDENSNSDIGSDAGRSRLADSGSELADIDDLSRELSLIKQHEQFITRRKRRNRKTNIANSANGRNAPPKEAGFSNKMIKGLLENLQLGDTLGSGLDASLFNALSYKFIDTELLKTIEMSKGTGLGDRIVHTEVLYDSNENEKEEDEEESMLLYAMHNWDIETVKELEGVLYSNKAVRKRRADYNSFKRKELAHKEAEEEVEIEQVSDDPENIDADNNDKVVDLKDLDTHITLGIANEFDQMDDSSDYEIPFAEEEEEEEEEQ